MTFWLMLYLLLLSACSTGIQYKYKYFSPFSEDEQEMRKRHSGTPPPPPAVGSVKVKEFNISHREASPLAVHYAYLEKKRIQRWNS
jgi:hypothetical protein